MTQKIVTPERPLAVPPLLAAEIGFLPATILQQINYWFRKSKHVFDGIKWFYLTYRGWHQQCPFASVSTIRRAIAFLKARGLIFVEKKSSSTCYHANWYTINEEKVKELWKLICSKRANRSAQSEQIDLPKMNTSSIYTETSPQKNISTDTPPNPPQECNENIYAETTSEFSSQENISTDIPANSPQECDAPIRPKTALVVNQGIQKCAEILSQLSIKVEERQKRHHAKAKIDSLDKLSAAAPRREKLPSIPLEDELKYQGVDTSNRWLLEAVAQSPDPYLAIHTWLAWARETTVEAPTQSLLKAIRDGWRPRDPVESGNIGVDALASYELSVSALSLPKGHAEVRSAAPLNNSQQKPFLESIPPCPEGLGEWAKYHKLSHRVRAIAYSDLLKCWCVYYNDTTCLPWIDAVNQGATIFKVARNDSGFYVEVQF